MVDRRGDSRLGDRGSRADWANTSVMAKEPDHASYRRRPRLTFFDHQLLGFGSGNSSHDSGSRGHVPSSGGVHYWQQCAGWLQHSCKARRC